MATNSKSRFSNRVEDYVKYRPGYPPEIVPFLQQTYSLKAPARIADIGAGTGISAELFLKAGYNVVAVEPNREMREKSVELLGHYADFEALDGSAENTNLPDHSVDAIVAGQAFHWFDIPKTKPEFRRILNPNGLVVLIWNERLTDSVFEKDYDALIIRHGRDYVQVDHRNIDLTPIQAFFSPAACQLTVFPNQQVFDYPGLEGRLSSSSYMPARDEADYAAMIEDLKMLFAKHQRHNRITIQYDTKVFSGRFQ